MSVEDDQENLEEIEALLYAQVYHESAAENQVEESKKELVTTSTVNVENNSESVTVQKQTFRYFDECNKLIFYEDRSGSLNNSELQTASDTLNQIPNKSATESNIAPNSTIEPLPNYLPLISNCFEEPLPDFVTGIIQKFRGVTPEIVQICSDVKNWSFSLKQQYHLYVNTQKKKIFIKALRREIQQHITAKNKLLRVERRKVERLQRLFEESQARANQRVIFLSSDSENEVDIANAGSNSKRAPSQGEPDPSMSRNSQRNVSKSAKKCNQRELPPKNDNDENDSNDDEIIYIAPPPIPVVNVDVTESEDSETEDETWHALKKFRILENETSTAENHGESVEKSISEEQPPPDEPVDENTLKNKKSKSVDPAQTEPKSPGIPSTSFQVEEEASNDFLSNEPSQSQTDNFNFSLHGSEFNNADFVRPANPAEFYETESSTSTSDFNRDSSRNYSNSVKTIVFNEVEFPKEDIFTNNLEGFEELITTKETAAKKKKGVKEKGKGASKSSKKTQKEGSDSSSESDYEQTFDNLPSLSPMVRTSSPKKGPKTTPKSTKKKKRMSEEPMESLEEKSSSKKKKKIRSLGPENSENQPVEPEEGYVVDQQTPKKKKNKSDGLEKPLEKDSTVGSIVVDEAQETPNKKANKKKKKKSGSKSNEEIEEQVDGGVVSNMDVELKKFYAEVEEQIAEEPVPSKKKKRKNNKKKKENDTQETENQTTSNVAQAETPQDSDSSNKNSDKNGDQNDDEVILIDTTPAPIEIPDSDNDSGSNDDGPVVETPDLLLANAISPTKGVTETVKSGLEKDFSEFDLPNLQAKMSDDPSLWRISIHDRMMGKNKKRGPRCHKCRQFGHLTVKCPNRSSQPSCQLCGEVGHEEPRCPNRVCFSCGNKGNFSTVYCWRCVKNRNHECTVCKCVGHISKNCPDLWRRYHLTTTPGPLVTPTTGAQLKPKKERWCAGCASQGHLDYECNSYKYIREYPATLPSIKEYSCVYDEDKIPQKPPEESVNLAKTHVVDGDSNASQINVVISGQEGPPKPLDVSANDKNDVPKETFEKSDLEPSQNKNVPKLNIRDRLEPRPNPRVKERLEFRPSENRFQPNESTIQTNQNFMQSNRSIFEIKHQLLQQMAGYNTQPVLNVFAASASNIVGNQINFLNDVNNTNSMPPHLLSNSIGYVQNEPMYEPEGDTYNIPPRNVYNIPARNSLYEEPPRTATWYNNTYHNFLQSLQRHPSAPGNVINFSQNFEQPPQNKQTRRERKNMSNFQKESVKLFREAPIKKLHEFVQEELNSLRCIDGNPNNYRKMLHTVGKKPEQKEHLYKNMNMFLFGHRKLKDGKRHYDFLLNFVYQPGICLKPGKRCQLHEAYKYIFGGMHKNVNYKMLLNNLVVGNRSGCQFE